MAAHPSAIIDSHADIDSRAEIGPMVVISGHEKIGAGTVVDPFVHILGFTEIGTQCHIHSGAVIGDLPQDKHYEGGKSFCRVGDHTIVREAATIHRGTAAGSTTVVGSGCYRSGLSHKDAIAALVAKLCSPAVQRLADFVQRPSVRGVAGGSHRPTLRAVA